MSEPEPQRITGAEALLSVIAAQALWRRMTRAQRAALLDVAADQPSWTPKRRTLDALRRRGLVDEDGRITPAGRAVVQWRPGKEGAS